MKYRFFSQTGLWATFLFTFLLPAFLMAQTGVYTVSIKQPVSDPYKSCPGKSVIFMAEGQNDDPTVPFDPDLYTFTWDFGYNGITKTGVSAAFAYPEGGHYTVHLYVKGKVSGLAAQTVPEKNVLIGLRPSFSGTRPDQTSICSGNIIALNGFATSIPWTKDTFQFENTFLDTDYTWNGIGIQSDHKGIAKVKPPLDKGDLKYVFRVLDDFGCAHDTTLTLFGVYASFKVTPKTGEAPLEVTMTIDSSSNGGDKSLITYDWEFFENSGDTANLLTTTDMKFLLERPGVYTSRVVARYQQCRNVFTYKDYIRVDSSLLEIPNVFTPNEDGVNDYFQVKALSLKSFSGRIMNRWGRVVYEWTDPKTLEKGWNGRNMNDGQPAPPGTYYYIISATGYDDKVYQGKINEKIYYGFLTLFR